MEGRVWTAEAVIQLAIRYYLRVGDAPLRFSRADDLRIFPKGRLIPGAAMMRSTAFPTSNTGAGGTRAGAAPKPTLLVEGDRSQDDCHDRSLSGSHRGC